jgi:hypothetical protein
MQKGEREDGTIGRSQNEKVKLVYKTNILILISNIANYHTLLHFGNCSLEETEDSIG